MKTLFFLISLPLFACDWKNDIIKNEDGSLTLVDECTKEQEEQGELKLIFEDGKQYNKVSLSEIRARIIEQ